MISEMGVINQMDGLTIVVMIAGTYVMVQTVLNLVLFIAINKAFNEIDSLKTRKK